LKATTLGSGELEGVYPEPRREPVEWVNSILKIPCPYVVKADKLAVKRRERRDRLLIGILNAGESKGGMKMASEQAVKPLDHVMFGLCVISVDGSVSI